MPHDRPIRKKPIRCLTAQFRLICKIPAFPQNCQDPHLFTKVTAADLSGLTRQLTQRKLADLPLSTCYSDNRGVKKKFSPTIRHNEGPPRRPFCMLGGKTTWLWSTHPALCRIYAERVSSARSTQPRLNHTRPDLHQTRRGLILTRPHPRPTRPNLIQTQPGSNSLRCHHLRPARPNVNHTRPGLIHTRPSCN